MDDARYAHVGSLMTDPARRSAWHVFALALEEAHDGPLAGYAFHGTTAAAYGRMMREGFLSTEVVLHREGPDGLVEGTFWARPLVAAFYAEDRIESTEDPDADLVILAVPVADLAAHGRLVQDEMSIECPVESRIGMDVETVYALYDRLVAEGEEPWRASLEATHSFACVAEEGPDMRLVTRLACADDVAALVASLGSGPTPSR